jgi:dTMP kinase
MHTQETYLGKLVAFEGIDRAGKTSIVRDIPSRLRACKVPIVTCGERGSPLAALLSKERLSLMTPFLKTYLFAADRAWTYAEKCDPALDTESLVLWDRYVASALAYRAVEFSLRMGNVDIEFVRHINRPFRSADLTVYIDVSAETSEDRGRMSNRPSPYSLEVLEMVRSEYRRMAKHPDYVVIDGERPLDLVTTDVTSVITGRFGDLFK